MSGQVTGGSPSVAPRTDGSPSQESRTGEVLAVVAALVERTGPDGEPQVFLARRAPGCRDAGSWELPGGKVEPGEEPEAALPREIREELGVGTLLLGSPARYELSIRGRAALFIVFPSRFEGKPEMKGSHDAMSYFAASEALDLDLAPLDRPALEAWASSRTGRDPSRRPRCGA